MSKWITPEEYEEAVADVATYVRGWIEKGNAETTKDIREYVQVQVYTHPFGLSFSRALQVLLHSGYPYAVDKDSEEKNLAKYDSYYTATLMAAKKAMEQDVLSELGSLEALLIPKKVRCVDCDTLCHPNSDGRCSECHASVDTKPWGVWFIGKEDADDDDKPGWCMQHGGPEFYEVAADAQERIDTYWAKGHEKNPYIVKHRITGNTYKFIVFTESKTLVEKMIDEISDEMKVKATLELLE